MLILVLGDRVASTQNTSDIFIALFFPFLAHLYFGHACFSVPPRKKKIVKMIKMKCFCKEKKRILKQQTFDVFALKE